MLYGVFPVRIATGAVKFRGRQLNPPKSAESCRIIHKILNSSTKLSTAGETATLCFRASTKSRKLVLRRKRKVHSGLGRLGPAIHGPSAQASLRLRGCPPQGLGQTS